MEHNVLRITNEYLLKSNYVTYPITFEVLEKLCTEQGYVLLSYSQAADTINAYKLKAHTNNKAFIFTSPDKVIKAIFYSDNLVVSDLLFSIACLIGSIILNSFSCGAYAIDPNDEIGATANNEAVAFAYQLLAPISVLRAKNIKNLEQIESETLLDKEYSYRIFRLLSTRKYEPLAKAVAFKYAKKSLTLRNTLVFLLLIILIAASAALWLITKSNPAQQQQSSSGSGSGLDPITSQKQVKEWYLDEYNIYHVYSDCPALEGQIFVKGPISVEYEDIDEECSHCKERRLSEN